MGYEEKLQLSGASPSLSLTFMVHTADIWLEQPILLIFNIWMDLTEGYSTSPPFLKIHRQYIPKASVSLSALG